MNRARKKPLLAPFGATISGRIGLYYLGHGKIAVLGLPWISSRQALIFKIEYRKRRR
jgi:hypothetical protein